MEQEKKSGSNKLLIILLILLLFGSLIGNWLQYKKNAEIVTEKTNVINSLDSVVTVRIELGKELELTTNEFLRYRGLSENLDSLLDIANKKIEDQKRKITSLAKNGDKLKVVELELTELKRLREFYLEKIDSLIQVNDLLKAENTAFKETIQSLETEKVALERKVEIASVLQTQNITVLTYKQRSSGKYASTVLAKKSKKIDVCFELNENKVSELGEYKIYLKIITPEGVTLSNSSSGSGTFIVEETKQQSQYTLMNKFNYQRKKELQCMSWTQEIAFAAGNYKVEIYCNGYMSGVGGFILK